MKQNKEFLKFLIDKGISKTKLAEKVGVTWQTVYYWSIGRNKPSLEMAVKMAEVLDVPIEAIYKIFA